MHPSDISDLLVQFGGKRMSDRDGEFWRFTSGEFAIDVEPFQTEQRWGFDCSLEHRSFSKLANHISGDSPNNFVCIRWFQRMQADGESVRTTIAKVLDSAFAASIDDCTATFLERIPEKSVPQICHLASLAKAKDFMTLLQYQERFRRGDRGDFVPMIAEQMIDRAVNLALEDA